MGVTQRYRTCKQCRKQKDKFFDFYSPTEDVCIACNPEVNFIKRSRRLAKERGPAALEERIRDYIRRARITRSVLRSIRLKEKA